jgi:transcriptional regulator with XRE-family HTH domain
MALGRLADLRRSYRSPGVPARKRQVVARGHHEHVASRTSLLDEARVAVRRAVIDLARDVRNARVSSGLSQREAGGRVGMSHAQFGRIERATLAELTVEQAGRACAAVGLRLILKAVPGGDPALDAGQLALLDRFRRRLPGTVLMGTEVPLPIPGDRRAWDGFLRIDGVAIGVEAEARIRDAQAVDRRSALKRRDGAVDIVILLIADTRANRRMLALHREALRSSFPLDTRRILEALGEGRAPPASGIVVL